MNNVTTASRDDLLIMDVQQGIVQRFGDDQVLLGHIAAAIAAARAFGIPIIYVVVRFRKGYPEISDRNRSFAAIRAAGIAMEESNPATAIHPAVAPLEDDIVITKRRVGAFSGSDLDVVLRALQVDAAVALFGLYRDQRLFKSYMHLRISGWFTARQLAQARREGHVENLFNTFLDGVDKLNLSLDPAIKYARDNFALAYRLPGMPH